jgi:23S rRNA (uracil1939-C5)-methyltransferase
VSASEPEPAAPPVLHVVDTDPDLTSSGDAMARLPDGRVVFVRGAAPSEQVEIRLTSDRSRFARGQVVRVLRPGPERVEPQCAHFEVCGGCTLQHVAPEAQTRAKQKAVLDAVRRIGKVDAELRVDEAWTGPAYGYRSRVRWALAPGPTLGFRASGGRRRDVVEIDDCPVLVAPLRQAMATLRESVGKVTAIDEIDAVASDLRALVRLPSRVGKSARPASGTDVELVQEKSRRTLPITDGHGPLELSPGVFAQASYLGNTALVGYVAELLDAGGPARSLLELYSGSGNLTRVLAPRAPGGVLAVEGDGGAVRLAKRADRENVRLEAAPVEAALRHVLEGGWRPDVVVANPPRPGLSEEAADAVVRLAPERMIYVSCDPATFSRDLARLAPVLAPRRLRLFDLYPQTHHAEVVCLLESI